jgi:hypothetical protein
MSTHTLPAVPPMNFKAIREALKAHGVTLVDVQFEVECRCEVCGAEWSEEGSLEDRLAKTWWQCWKCNAEEEHDAHA